ncbi:MAG TPA: hypothetical protein VNJ47_10570 [Nevskiales bacterium]|nr:hypothetical protein [Nevskiales bacterium]
MSRHVLPLLFTLLLAACATGPVAQEPVPPWSVVGVGNARCQDYSASLGQPAGQRLREWVLGYAAGLDAPAPYMGLGANPGAHPVAADELGAQGWLAQHCAANPERPLHLAVRQWLSEPRPAVAKPVTGLGGQPCSDYNAHGDGTPERALYEQWMLGFITGLNARAPYTSAVLSGADLNADDLWRPYDPKPLQRLTDYCREQPQATFQAAVERLAAREYWELQIRERRENRRRPFWIFPGSD